MSPNKMMPSDSGIATGRVDSNHPDGGRAAVSLIRSYNSRKRKVRGKAGFLVDSDDDEPLQETVRKVLSVCPPSSTLQKRRLKARNPFLLSPSPPPLHTQDGVRHTVEDGEEALEISFPKASDGNGSNTSSLSDPQYGSATEKSCKTTTKTMQSSEGSSATTQTRVLDENLVTQQPPGQPRYIDSNFSIFEETRETQTANGEDLPGHEHTTSSGEPAAETYQISQSTNTNTTLSCTIEDTKGSHGSRLLSLSGPHATKRTLEESANEKKHVSFAEQEVFIPLIGSEAPHSPSEESLASLFGDDDTDFDKELGLGSCASPGGASTADSSTRTADGTPDPDYPRITVEWKTRVFDYFNPYAAWSGVPSADAVVAALKAAHDPRLHYAVEPLFEGTYNRFYAVAFSGDAYVLKVTLPVCPRRKTASEVATLRWTLAHTRLPVPAVVASGGGGGSGGGLYSASAANPLGCEWILFDRVEGRPLSECWRAMDFDVKQRVVVQLAAYTTTVWELPFDAIGSLYLDQSAAGRPDTRFRLGEIVSMHLFWNGRCERFGPATGPFATYREWAFERLDLVVHEAFTRLPQIVDRRLRDWPWRIRAVAHRLRVLHDRLFPPDMGQGKAGESTMLWHDNLSADNIFVDDNGVLTGILDWDSVSCTPRSLCDLPAFLQDSPNRAEPPDLARHWDFADTHAPLASYWPLLREAEITELRALFLAEMERQCLAWAMTYRYNRLRRDFEAAVQHCDHPLMLHVVENWLDAVDRRLAAGNNPKNLKVWSLQERCIQGVRNKG